MDIRQIARDEAPRILASALIDALERFETVIWFVPGGSNIFVAAAASKLISEDLSEKLVVTQTDERYGPIDHPDSNWRQLREAGADFKKAKTLPALTDDTLSLEDTAKYFNEKISKLLALPYKIGQFGVGSDGHIAGIKPNSPAAVSKDCVAGYEAEDFKRITLTFGSIKRIDEIRAFVFGEEKRSILASLKRESNDTLMQPAQVLKEIQKSTLYCDLQVI